MTVGWRLILAIMLVCHCASNFLLRFTSTVAPHIVDQFGWSPGFVGWLATAGNLGSILMVATGVGALRAFGSLRAIRIGLFAAGAGALALTLPLPLLAMLACFVIGVGHGPANPAGNDMLQQHVPVHRRGLIFSVKQSSVPVAGVLGGLVLPPVAETWGVEWAMALCTLVALLAVASTLPLGLSAPLPARRDILALSLSRQNLMAPVRAVLTDPGLRAVAGTGFLLGFVQSVWFVFLTIFMVFELGYSGTEAGILYALMQGMSIVGRLVSGWAADRLGSGMSVILWSLILSVVSSLCLAMLVLVGPGWFAVTVCLFGGFAAAGWNGVQIAEAVRLAPSGQIYEAVSGVTLALGLGVSVGPILVSAMLDLGLGWGVILPVVALVPLLGLPMALSRLRADAPA